ncbi:hypothetical protein GUJ93_ZPchr0013g35772 [Zizania palustris]|uniref:Peroxisomal nicotinamide adenine dinucleotide carrier n=1 Tax=Zizania palustris TaxID=103762 RepID=A0A8J5X3I7_ZIZPA|nr:hypothetical protein GUJ93_ZPchr0013g35772 [Zizania palustris]
MSDALINGVAGAGGGIIAQLLTYPLQTVNARQQTERDPSKPAFKDGAVRQMCQVVKHEGWERLYGGLTPSLVGTAASQGVYYYVYQIFRSRAEAAALQRSRRGVGDGSVGMLQSLTVAALSGCINVLLTNPIWVVVTRMQTHRKANREQSRQDLTIALEKALEAPTVENIPHKTIHVIFLLGAVAKLGATVVTYPLLVVKARLQVKEIIEDKRHRYKGTFDAITKMMRYEEIEKRRLQWQSLLVVPDAAQRSRRNGRRLRGIDSPPLALLLLLPFVSSASASFLPSSSSSRVAVPAGKQKATVSVLRALRAEAATLPVLSFSGEKIGEVDLDLKSAPPSTARAVVHRALITDRQNKRRGTASTLTRGEVRGGGRKPYQQKKTGKARRGSTRTPLRPGGGVIFGPKPGLVH